MYHIEKSEWQWDLHPTDKLGEEMAGVGAEQLCHQWIYKQQEGRVKLWANQE